MLHFKKFFGGQRDPTFERDLLFQIVCTISGELVDYTLCLPPTNEVCEGYVFTGVSLSTGGGSLSRRGGL